MCGLLTAALTELPTPAEEGTTPQGVQATHRLPSPRARWAPASGAVKELRPPSPPDRGWTPRGGGCLPGWLRGVSEVAKLKLFLVLAVSDGS